MSALPIQELYTKFGPAAGAVPLLPGAQREVGHFNLFHLADLMPNYRTRPPMTFDRRAFYKISLICGRSRIEYADQVVEVEGKTLWFVTHRVPYRWVPHDLDQTGFFCVFTDEFMHAGKGGLALEELAVFQPRGCPILHLTDDEYAQIELLFSKMSREIKSDYPYKYDLLRAYLTELVHLGQKLQPAPAATPTHSAAARLAAQFAELLERQFPLDVPQQRLRLRTAADYADQLAVHVNHLNRVLKETTGHTTTGLIAGRLAQEAKLLLKHTNWTVAEIADSLGFTDTAHFCHFFKRQASATPGDFRG